MYQATAPGDLTAAGLIREDEISFIRSNIAKPAIFLLHDHILRNALAGQVSLGYQANNAENEKSLFRKFIVGAQLFGMSSLDR